MLNTAIVAQDPQTGEVVGVYANSGAVKAAGVEDMKLSKWDMSY